MVLLSLTACAKDSSSGIRFAGVPLKQYPPTEQANMADHLQTVCGKPPRCPPGSPEQWVLDYGQLRAEVRAANPK